jgi:hypothetical protein
MRRQSSGGRQCRNEGNVLAEGLAGGLIYDSTRITSTYIFTVRTTHPGTKREDHRLLGGGGGRKDSRTRCAALLFGRSGSANTICFPDLPQRIQ